MSRFRLTTLNLFSRWVDLDDLARAIDELTPDVMVVQEMTADSAAVIAGSFPTHDLRPDPSFAGWGIAGRIPIEVAPERPGWGRGGFGRVEIAGRTVHLAATHILDPMHRPLTRNRKARRAQTDALLSWGETRPVGDPQVVAGDMNASPIWEVYRRLTEVWDDVVLDEARRRGAKPARTWGLAGLGTRLLRIDHVLGRGLIADRVRVDPVKGSDHSALTVDLVLQ